MGRINDTTKYPNDGSISITDILIGSDGVGGATRTYPLEGIANLVIQFLERLKNPSSAIYDGFIIIAAEGNTDTTSVEIGDIMIGRNSTFSTNEFIFAIATQLNPTNDTGITIKMNLQ